MEFLSVASDDLAEGKALCERYYEYLESVKERMPQEAYSFAVAKGSVFPPTIRITLRFGSWSGETWNVQDSPSSLLSAR
jgi:hypothetical protein